MNSRELDYNDYLLAIGDKRMGTHRDILWYLHTCKLLVGISLVPFYSPMLDYSIDGRVCKAG
jgi:hypothetical protein